jgi:cellulose synthase operon protein C
VKTFNVRLAVILLVTFVVLGVGVFFLNRFQVRRNAGFFLDQAEIAKAEAAKAHGSDKKAEQKAIQEQLKNFAWYLRLAPNDAQAVDVMEQFGILSADNIRDSDSFNNAMHYLETVIVRDAERPKARRKLIEFYMRDDMQRYKDARPHIDVLLAKKPDDPEMLTLLGRCLVDMDDAKKAKEKFLEAIKFAPKQCEAYFYLAQLLQMHPELCDKVDENAAASDPEKPKTVENTPESVMAAMLERNPDSSKAHFYMCQYLISQRGTLERRKEALAQAEKALELAPDDRDALFMAARLSLETGDAEKGRMYAQQGLDKEKDLQRFRREMYLYLADSENRLKNRKQAVEIIQKAFKETNDPLFLWVHADWQIEEKDIEAAKASLKKLDTMQFDDRGSQYLRAKIAFVQGRWADACRAFEAARSFFNNRPDQQRQVEYALSICYGQLGNKDQQKLVLRKILDRDPFYEPAIRDISVLTRSGPNASSDLNLNATLNVIKNAKDPRTLLAMVPQAVAQFKSLPKEDQNWKVLEDLLDEVQKNFPDMVEMPLFRCDILRAQGHEDDAVKMLRDLLAKNPKVPQYWQALTMLLIQQKKLDEAEKLLAAYEKAAGDTLELRVMKANFYLRKSGKEALPQLKALKENTDAFNDQQKNALWSSLLNIMREIGAKDEAQELTKLMAQRDPNNINYLLISFEQAYDAGDLKRMEQVADDVERVEGQGPYWYTCQAILRIQKVVGGGDQALLDEALKLLEKAKEKRANWPKIPYLTGRIYDAKKDPVKALNYYQEAISLGDYQPIALSRVIDILCQQQKIVEANGFMRRLDAQHVSFSPELTKKWVLLSLHPDVRDYETALENARKVATDQKDSYKDMIWFGQVLDEIDRQTAGADRKKEFQGLGKERENAYRRAMELAADVPEVRVVFINYLVSADKLTEAEAVFEEGKKQFTGKEGQLAAAQCLEVLKKYEQAKAEYELVLAANAQDSKTTRAVAEFFIRMSGANSSERANYVKQAETLLNRMIDGKDVKSEKADVLWARNRLALIISTRSGYENVEKARALIKKNLEANPESIEDKRLLAQINLADPRATYHDEAQKILKGLLENQNASNEDQLRLAQLYLASGNWRAAGEVLRQLAIGAQDPKYLALYIRELLDHGEVSDAEIYLRQLQDKWPNFAQTVVLQAELLVRTNKAEEALDLMKSFVDRTDAIPADRGLRIRLMAEAMENFVQRIGGEQGGIDTERYLRTAEMYQRQYADEHPSSSLDVVEFLARQRRFDDATDMLEQNWKTAEPLALHGACMLVTESGRGAKETVDRVVRILNDAKTQFQDHPTILLTLGDLKVGAGQYQEGEDYYRQILKDNPAHTVAMNNLAVLLTVSRKNLKEAADLINKAIEITGPLAQMLDTRACVSIAQGDAGKAMTDMKEVLADRKDPERLFHYAQALELAGQNNAAAAAMQEALQTGLLEKNLLTPEIPNFNRLRELAHQLSPVKTEKAPKK